MRKIISGILVVVFLFDLIGYYPVFLIQQQILRSVMQEAIQKESYRELLQLTFDENEQAQLIWHREDEFSWKGKMYDVVRVCHIDEQTIQYYCINDNKETDLIAAQKQKQGNEQNNNRNLPNSICLVLTAEYQNPYGKFNFSPNDNGKILSPYINNYLSRKVKTDSPPPKV